MKRSHTFLALAAVLLTAGCNKGGTEADNAPITAEPVAPPAGGDWAKMVTVTPEGGYLMGNPNASVKLIEYGSLTCPHCAEFDEKGMQPLVDNYVKKGLVSLEFRNFVRDQFDIAASLLARCGGPDRFFPMARAFYADQQVWMQKAIDQPEKQQALQSLPPNRIFVEAANIAGLQPWAAQRGLPSAQANACLANEGEVTKLVQMQGDAVANFKVPGTPAFIINGKLVENAATWEALEPELRKALR
ncbi:MAG TPA: thioredoxin domain-containing protein [Sphingomicrobium sp.]|jgi:protein-disulfide isomerase|nr:thioredoxin domain-containing protein [Sphingomicrobium sp.]